MGLRGRGVGHAERSRARHVRRAYGDRELLRRDGGSRACLERRRGHHRQALVAGRQGGVRPARPTQQAGLRLHRRQGGEARVLGAAGRRPSGLGRANRSAASTAARAGLPRVRAFLRTRGRLADRGARRSATPVRPGDRGVRLGGRDPGARPIWRGVLDRQRGDQGAAGRGRRARGRSPAAPVRPIAHHHLG